MRETRSQIFKGQQNIVLSIFRNHDDHRGFRPMDLFINGFLVEEGMEPTRAAIQCLRWLEIVNVEEALGVRWDANAGSPVAKGSNLESRMRGDDSARRYHLDQYCDDCGANPVEKGQDVCCECSIGYLNN